MAGNDTLRILPFGGLGEIGMNMTLFGVGDDWFIVDAGVQFCDPWMIGADVSLPDLGLLAEYRDRIKAIVITHGHEDHIGALDHVSLVCPVPVYAPSFACELLRLKEAEFGAVSSPDLHEVAPGDKIRVGPMSIEFIRVTHSIPDCLGLAIRTPAGLVVHSGDFRMDPDPLDGDRMDTAKFKELGDEGVRLLMSDSTNALVTGRIRPESVVGDEVGKAIANAPGRVIVALFASNVHRIQRIADAAISAGKRVALLGRSLHIYQKAARRSGQGGEIPALVDESRLKQVTGEDLLVICTGSQAEGRSVLSRASRGEHPNLRIGEGDLVVMSSKIIPGNERPIHRMINNITRLGARVLTEKTARIHGSGHARQDELRELIELVRPQTFMPIHGEYAFLQAHADLASLSGVDDARVIENGQVLDVTKDNAVVSNSIDLNNRFVDGPVVGDASELRLSQRRRIGWTGVVAATLRLTKKRGNRRVTVDVRTIGFPIQADDMLDAAADHASEEVMGLPDNASVQVIEETLTRALRSFFKRRLERKPVVVTFVDAPGG